MEIPDNFRPVWDTRELKNLSSDYRESTKPNFNPFTEVEPPSGPNIQITGFNWSTNTWDYIEAATPEDLAAQDEQTTDTMVAVSELYEMYLTLQTEFEEFKANK